MQKKDYKQHAYLEEMNIDRQQNMQVYSDCKVKQVPVKDRSKRPKASWHQSPVNS